MNKLYDCSYIHIRLHHVIPNYIILKIMVILNIYYDQIQNYEITIAISKLLFMKGINYLLFFQQFFRLLYKL